MNPPMIAWPLHPQEQLNGLMKTLHATQPHFIRCIIPNEFKQSGRFFLQHPPSQIFVSLFILSLSHSLSLSLSLSHTISSSPVAARSHHFFQAQSIVCCCFYDSLAVWWWTMEYTLWWNSSSKRRSQQKLVRSNSYAYSARKTPPERLLLDLRNIHRNSVYPLLIHFRRHGLIVFFSFFPLPTFPYLILTRLFLEYVMNEKHEKKRHWNEQNKNVGATEQFDDDSAQHGTSFHPLYHPQWNQIRR